MKPMEWKSFVLACVMSWCYIVGAHQSRFAYQVVLFVAGWLTLIIRDSIRDRNE